MNRGASTNDALADKLQSLERTVRWTTGQKEEIRHEASLYQAFYEHLKGELDSAEEARALTFDKRHKISYETARDTVVRALSTDNVAILNGLLVATGNLKERKLEAVPPRSASEWTKWITTIVNNPLNVYLGLSKYNSALGRKWDPREKDNEFGTLAPSDRFEPGSPVTAWQRERHESPLDPTTILSEHSVLEAAWAVHEHYERLAHMAKGDAAEYFRRKLTELPHHSWGTTEQRTVASEDDDFQAEVRRVLKDRPSAD